MADLFPGASALGDSVEALFGGTSDSAAVAGASRQITSFNKLQTALNLGVNSHDTNRSDANRNSPQYGNEKNKPAPTEDPQEVEARWMARLAKFAGIAQGTGVKIGM